MPARPERPAAGDAARWPGGGSQRGRPLLRALCVALALAAAPSAPARAGDWGLAPLLQDIAAHSAAKVRFVERKFISVLDAPVDSSGELQFVAPARLEKRTLKPRAELLVLDGDQLTIERQGARRTLSLQQMPEAASIVESLRATLGGDRTTLERNFRVTLKGSREHWNLSLKPIGQRAAGLVSEVRITGQQGQVDLVEVDQADGDRSVMRVLPAQ